MKVVRFLILFLSGFGTAFANFDISKVGGRQVVRFNNVGASQEELCILPRHFEGAAYEYVIKSDGSLEERDVKIEEELCSADLHNTSESTFDDLTLKPRAVCPKLNSTNPGLEIFKIPEELKKSQIENKACKIEGLKKIAKYKVSTSCSYTPVILGYYHLSRMLGNILHVPVAVLRTIDQGFHADLARQGLRLTPEKELIHQTFATLSKGLEGHGSASFNDKVLTNTRQSYGALVASTKNESFYKEFFNQGSDRAVAFKQKNTYFKKISMDRPLVDIIGKELTKESLQSMVAMKDLSDMLVIDYLMNQKDRFGNIASADYVYFKDSSGALVRAPVSKASEKSAGAFVIKEMVLKDNDCGGAERPNITKMNGFIDSLRHIHPMTYQRILWLNSAVDSKKIQEFFAKELLFTVKDQAMFRTNLSELSGKLRTLCQKGQLRLDLDYQQHFQGLESAVSTKCDLN